MEPIEAIKQKCVKNCGMIKAWDDGVCRADGLCPLYEWSPLRQNGLSGASETISRPSGYEDL